MDRHILGTFRDTEETVKEVKRLINEEGYTPDELMLIMDNNHNYERNLYSLKNVEVSEIEVEEESLWDKIKETFSFGAYDSQEDVATLENFGVPQERSEDYMDALRDGEIILLANSDAPANNGLSELNKEVILNEERRMDKMEKNNEPIDEVNTKEEEAIKNKENPKPSDVETSEIDTDNMTDTTDASQAENTRSEEAKKQDKDSENSNEDTHGTESKEEPDLTGDEKSVSKVEKGQSYGNTIAKGVVRPEAESPLNTAETEDKSPSEDTETPDADATYSDEQEEAGMQSED